MCLFAIAIGGKSVGLGRVEATLRRLYAARDYHLYRMDETDMPDHDEPLSAIIARASHYAYLVSVKYPNVPVHFGITSGLGISNTEEHSGTVRWDYCATLKSRTSRPARLLDRQPLKPSLCNRPIELRSRDEALEMLIREVRSYCPVPHTISI